MQKSTYIVIALIAASFLVAAYFYPQLPEKVVTHWGLAGEPNGFMDRFWGSFIMPALILGLSVLFLIIPGIDPLKENIKQFRKYFDGFIVLFLLFLLSLQLFVILWNVGFIIPILPFISIWLGVLFFAVGALCENAKKNWFIGFRTPWTMSSEAVWDKTNKLGGKLFKACGIISLFGGFVPDYAFIVILVPVFVSAFYTTYYSYREYQKEQRK